MAIRTKTVEFALSSSGQTLAANVVREFTPLTIYIPETGSRVFRSCFVEYFVEDAQETAASPTSWDFRYRVGTGTPSTASITRTIANTGEHQAYAFVVDVTFHFSSSFGASDTSKIFVFGNRIAVSATSNGVARLFVTYDWDDAAQTRIKTVTIPMNGLTGSCNATSSAGTVLDIIPALDTYLPESGKVYRNISIELEGNDFVSLANTITPTASLFIDETNVESTGQIFTNLASARLFRYNFIPAFDTSLPHTASLRTEILHAPFTNISAKCVVTYEYDHAASTKVMNCVMLPAADDNGLMGGNTDQFRSRFSRELTIQEPQITMSRCGTYYSLIDSSLVNFRPSVTEGIYTQSLVTYTFPAVVTCGGWAASQRFDGTGGAVGGQGMSLNRGSNTFTLDWFRTGVTNGTLGSQFSVIAYFNYESAISSQDGGDANHVHIIKQFYSSIPPANVPRTQTIQSLNFAETSSYWLTSMGMKFYIFSAAAASAVVLQAMATGSDGENYGNYGWEPLYSGLTCQDSEASFLICYARMRDKFRRFPDDPDKTRMDATRSRPYTIDIPTTNYPSCGYFFYSYHTIEYTLTGSISGSSGDGSGIEVAFHRADNNELVVKTTTQVGGSFSKIWYDNTRPLYAVARQDDNKVGRSANATASGTP